MAMRGSRHPAPFDDAAKRAAAIGASVAIGAFVPSDVKAGFNPAQPRAATGQWSAQSGQSANQKPKKRPKRKPAKPQAKPKIRLLERHPAVPVLRQLPGPKGLSLGAQLHIIGPGAPNVRQDLADLERVPQHCIDLLKGDGVQIWIGNVALSKLDDLGSLAGQHPAGYPRGLTYDDGGAVTDYGLVAIGLTPQGASDSGSVLLHEIGHAMGYTAANADPNVAYTPFLVDDPEWVAIYHKMYKDLDPYLQQGGPDGFAGRAEFFAEAFAMTVTNESAARAMFYGNEAVDWIKRRLGF